MFTHTELSGLLGRGSRGIIKGRAESQDAINALNTEIANLKQQIATLTANLKNAILEKQGAINLMMIDKASVERLEIESIRLKKEVSELNMRIIKNQPYNMLINGKPGKILCDNEISRYLLEKWSEAVR